MPHVILYLQNHILGSHKVALKKTGHKQTSAFLCGYEGPEVELVRARTVWHCWMRLCNR